MDLGRHLMARELSIVLTVSKNCHLIKSNKGKCKFELGFSAFPFGLYYHLYTKVEMDLGRHLMARDTLRGIVIP